MNRPSVQQLAYLVAVAEFGHIGRAAAHCHVSQPALSTQLKELERRVGTAVTERIGRSIRLTPPGEQLASRAASILRDIDDLATLGHSHGSHMRGPLHIAAIPTVAPYLLPHVVRHMRAEHKAAELHLHELQTEPLLDQLRAGTIDLGILALPFDHAGLASGHLLDDELLLAMPEDHHLVDTEPVSPSVLGQYDVIMLSDGHCLRDHALEVCAAAGRNASSGLQSTSLGTLCQMVAAGMGITLLPETARSVESRPGTGIYTRSFLDPVPTRRLVLAWRSATPALPLYEQLAESLALELRSAHL
jgi:LysR family hydrogen peroxide-inducible transcriptional activator